MTLREVFVTLGDQVGPIPGYIRAGRTRAAAIKAGDALEVVALGLQAAAEEVRFRFDPLGRGPAVDPAR